MTFDNPCDVPAHWQVGDVILDLYEVRPVVEGFGRTAREREYHEGGFGRVYKVWHRTWQRDIAVKTPRADVFATEKQRDIFIRECETWGHIGLHAHIAACHYVRNLGGVPRIFSEYAPAGTLEDWIRSKRLYEGTESTSLARILDVFIQFAWGLHYAHEKGIIHQDVKPLNALMWNDGILKITDLGLAGAKQKVRLEDCSSNLADEMHSARVSTWGMTPSYCSPEQAEKGTLSRRTDLWSWAVSLLQAFQGEVTWQTGVAAAEALEAFLENDGKADGIPALPHGVAALLRQCLQKDPADRPRTLRDCATALCAVYDSENQNRYPRSEPEAINNSPDALNNRALSSIDLGHLDVAEDHFLRALRLDQHHLAATYNRALMHWRIGDFTDSDVSARVEEIRKDRPTDQNLECALACFSMENANFPKALSHFEKAIELGDISISQTGAEKARPLVQNGSGQCLRIFVGHTDSVHSVTFSPDGRFVLSGGSAGYSHESQAIRLWEVATGKCLRIFEGHTKLSNSVALFLGDGRYVLSGGHHSDVCVWEVSSGRCLRTFDPSDHTFYCMAVSPDNRFAVTAGASGAIYLWDIANSRRLRQFAAPMCVISAVAFSPDGQAVLSGGSDNTLRLWDANTGRCLRIFEGHNDEINVVTFSPDGLFALSGSGSHHNAKDTTMRLWEVRTGRLLRIFTGHNSRINSAAFSPNGHFAVSGSNDKSMRLWNVKTGRCLRTFHGHIDRINSVAFSPDGRFVISGSGAHDRSEDKTIRLWDVASVIEQRYVSPWFYSDVITASEAAQRHRLHESRLSEAREAIASNRIAEALVSLRQAREIPGFEKSPASLSLQARVGARARIQSYAGGWLKRSFDGHTSYVTSVAFSPDGLFALSGGNGTPRLWDVTNGKCLRTFEGHTSYVCSIAFSPDGSLAVSASADCTLLVWDVATGQSVRKFAGHTNPVNSAVFSPDGQFILSGSGLDNRRASECDHTLRLWELATGRCLQRLDVGGKGPINSVAFSPDGRHALCGCAFNLSFWDMKTGHCLPTFANVNLCEVRSVAFSPDGRLALSGGGNIFHDVPQLHLWEIATGRCLRTLDGHTGQVHSVAFSSDGRFALSGSGDHNYGKDKTLRLWETATGECLRTFDGHANDVNSVTFSPDGRFAMSGSGGYPETNNTIHLWELDWDYCYAPEHDPNLRTIRHLTAGRL